MGALSGRAEHKAAALKKKGREHGMLPTPSPLCGLASWPLLGACFMYPGEYFLTWLELALSREMSGIPPSPPLSPGLMDI